MQRAPIVLSATALGLTGILSYHAASGSSSVHSITTASATHTTSATTSTTATKTASAASTTAVRSATGEDVQYRYGDLELKVTMSGSRITDIALVQLNATDPHSEQIDAQAIPELRAEALSAQSAQIDAVSGASYTSAAYTQSLQAALDRLKA